jgi:elongator complex protein 1
VTSDGTFKTVQLGWTIDHSTGTTDSDPAYAVNVDGNKVKVTPFRTMVVPPPISAFELHLPENVKQVGNELRYFRNTVGIFRYESFQVAFAPEPFSSRLAVFTATNKMFTFSEEKTEDSEMSQDLVKVTGAGGNGFIVKCSLLHPVASLKLSWDGAALANWIWLAGDMMLASCNQPIPSLHLFEITKDGNLSPKEAFPVEDTVYNISRSSDGNVAAVQLVNGDILKYDAEKEEVSPSDPLPSVCPWTAVVKVGEDTHVLALSARHRLYRNGVEIAGNITSVNVHSDFILATTLKHTLKCLPLANLGAATKEAAWFSESSRALERGSKLVVTVPRDSQIVLQMPRGNLELIHPRALALNIVKGNLDALKYGVSMETLRKHRISLNLFVDHNPDLFLANVDKFVEEIKDVQRICLFVADLLKEDTTTTLYGSMYPDRAAYSNWPSASNKIDTVCARLKDRLEQDAERNILPILSCLIKSSDSDVDAALKRIDVMRTANPAVADDALDFLLLLVDVNALFDVALGLYDFDLVLFVAEKSQKVK